MLEILKKEKVVNMKQSITTLFELYIDRSDLAESSVALKRRALKCFVEAFGDRSVESIDYATAEDYRTILVKERSKQSANTHSRAIQRCRAKTRCDGSLILPLLGRSSVVAAFADGFHGGERFQLDAQKRVH